MKSGFTTLTRPLTACVLGLTLIVLSPSTSAQTEPEPAGPSYHERWRVFKPGGGTKDVDPNVYAYTPEFAKRFQMPEEWISTELKGADAVAYRVVPAYATCGWGGDPNACRADEVRCEMDLYFDHQRNPLPWDERYPEVVADRYRYSSRFIPGASSSPRQQPSLQRSRANYLWIATVLPTNFSPPATASVAVSPRSSARCLA